jgi:hypothetical protein
MCFRIVPIKVLLEYSFVIPIENFLHFALSPREKYKYIWSVKDEKIQQIARHRSSNETTDSDDGFDQQNRLSEMEARIRTSLAFISANLHNPEENHIQTIEKLFDEIVHIDPNSDDHLTPAFYVVFAETALQVCQNCISV